MAEPAFSISAVATANAPVMTEGVLALLTQDLAGGLRITVAPGGGGALGVFQPLTGNAPSTSAAVANTSAQLTLANVPATGGTLRIAVDGNQRVAWAYGNVTATMNGSVRMLANTVETFAAAAGLTQISHIGDAAGSNISVTVGAGS